MLTVVTTCSQDGYERYGHRFLDTFAQYWPQAQVHLLFYSEDHAIVDRQPGAIDLLKAAPWLAVFKHHHRNDARANGRLKGFRWNAIRFAHKVAAIIAADELCSDDYLLWLDADIVTHGPIEAMAIASWLPGDEIWLSWLDRNPKVIGYPECGFLCFNRRYKFHGEALGWLKYLYSSGRVLELSETHDSYVFRYMVDELNLPTRSLSGDGFNTMHPLVNSPLGRWFDHLKGNRKSVGRSYRSDLLNLRDESYWKVGR